MPTTVQPRHNDLATYLALRQLWRDSPLVYVRQRFGIEPTWQQAEILQAMLPYGSKVSVRSGHGIGKAQPKDLWLDTPQGCCQFGDLQPGQFVFGPDGFPTEILSISDQGFLPTYNIMFDDGTSTRACGEHLWTVQGRQERRKELSTWRVISTHDLLALGVKRGNGTNEARQWALPKISLLQYAFSWVPVDPYTLGYWLGDGTRKTAMITTADDEPVRRIRQAGYEVIQPEWSRRTASLASVYYVKHLGQGLRALNVFECGAPDKFVPRSYKENISAIRLALLQGLLDSDGFVEPFGKPSFCSVSRQLAEDVAWLVRSLGGKARISGGLPKSYKNGNGELVQGRPAFNVTFAFDNDIRPFTILRKAERYRSTSQKRYVTRWIEAIKPVETTECQCITVARPDGLYLTNDCIVTHNSSGAAFGIYWFLETHNYAKVPCTAPSAHQLRDVLWGELSKWRRHADEQSVRRGDPSCFSLSHLFRLVTDRLFDSSAPEWGAIARTASKENPEAFQGFHAEHLLFILDEASGIPEAIYEAAEGALSTSGARVLMLGNPTRTSGTFYNSHHKDRGSYTALHFRSQDSPLVDVSYRERLVRKWGEGSNIVRVRADGDFPRQEDDVLISLDLTEPCLSRERCSGDGVRKLGVDVARMGADRTTLVLRQGRVVEHIRIFAKQDTMMTVGCIVAVLEAWRVEEIDVDVIGLGAGVYDRLAELKREGHLRCAVVAVNVAQKAPTVRHPADAKPRRLRDYLWLEVARWLREDDPVFVAADGQACEDLAGELASVHYGIDSQGFLVIEDKDAMRKRLGHSPDLADGLCCTMASPPKGGGMALLTGY
jgi:hypothetical protein